MIVYVCSMEISTVGVSGFRLKGKNSHVQIDRGVVSIGNDKPFKIDAPGEYEVGGVSVIGINDANDAKIYVVEMDGVRIAVLGKIEGKLTDIQIEDMGSIDILLCTAPTPETTSQIDPWVIVTETAPEGSAKVSKYLVTADKLPTETTTVILERKD